MFKNITMNSHLVCVFTTVSKMKLPSGLYLPNLALYPLGSLL